jgi:Cu(I)/Ag(I) efflux system membrane fusion protein
MRKVTIIFIVLVSILLGLGLGALLFPMSSPKTTEKKPLYWVAPMDSNYRRDQFGQSPMGMDLVPVYQKDDNRDNKPGVVNISPSVVNNLSVRVATVKEGLLNTKIKTVGYVKYDEDNLKHVHSRVEGWIKKLYVKAAGDQIKKDQALYDLYSPKLVNAQEEYLLALDYNDRNLLRASKLRLKSLQVSNHFIKQLKATRHVQQNVTFYAPQTGVIERLNIREGFFVQPDKTLISIGSLESIWVEAEIFERQAALVKQGQSVTISLSYQIGTKWQGHIDYVYPTLDLKTRTLRARIRLKNINEILKPNMYVEVDIYAENAEKLVLVPRHSVIRTGTRNTVVIALGEGKFKSIAVELGASDDQYIEITQGLMPGDKVVVSAQFLLDSESSKDSDFKRMYHEENEATSKAIETVWAMVMIKSVNVQTRRVRIEHGEIPNWNQTAMTMTIKVNKNVDITKLSEGARINMQLMKKEGEVVATDIHVMDKNKAAKEAENEEKIPMKTLNSKKVMPHNTHSHH